MNTRTRSLQVFPIFAAVALCTLASSRIASAAFPQLGLAVCNDPNTQQNSAITTDGAGGAIVAWQDSRTAPGVIAAHHVLASGQLDPAWPLQGRVLVGIPVPNANGGQFLPSIVSDGAGGAIVAWNDLRSAVTGIDLYAQHVLANGTLDPAWPATGRALSAAPGTQLLPRMVSDGAGGAIVAWMDDRPGSNRLDVFAQHVLASGIVDPAWPVSGFPVCTAAGTQLFPVITGDGSGGAIISWFDERISPNEIDIFAQRIVGAGAIAPGWPVNGRAVCAASGPQIDPTIVSDGAHGAVIAWADGRNQVNVRIFAQHVLGSGNVDPAWPLNGRSISGATVVEQRPLAVPDGAGGAVVTWEGFSNITSVSNIYAQHVLATGVVDPEWPVGGQTLSFRQKHQTRADIASDGAGGAFVAWDDNGQDVIAQHVLANGTLDPDFPADGRTLVNLPSQQGDAAIVTAGVGGAIVSWTDSRNGNADIFATQVLDARPTPVPAPTPAAIAFAPAFPNPARGSLTLRFVLPRETTFRMAIYDVAGRRVRELASGSRPAGEQTLAWDMRDNAGREVSSGIYFARLDADRHSLTQKLVKLK